MAVWTQVTLDEANEWLLKRGLTTASAIAPVEEGVEDSVFKLTLHDGSKACLRLFERTEPVGPLTIAARLAQSGLPTCPPVIDQNEEITVALKGKPAVLFPWIDGTLLSKPSLEQIEEIGIFMGRMAQAGLALGNEWQRENPRGWNWFKTSARKLMSVMPRDTADELWTEVNEQSAFWKNIDLQNVPHGPIHGDLFRNNVLFGHDGKLAAVLDWGFCASGQPLIYDLAIVANDWCLQDQSNRLDQTRINALMRGRESVLPLTPQEHDAWPMALRMAALRFYTSRLRDYHLPRDPDGKKLDPDHFQDLLCSHKAHSGTEREQYISSENYLKRPRFQRRNMMYAPYKLAVIGNGSTAINALNSLITHYESIPSVMAPLQITIFGESPEQYCGRGFAYGKVGSVIGNLTESPADGRADYSPEKGAFIRYATKLLGRPAKDMHHAPRQLIGEFHADRYQELKKKAASVGIDLEYQQCRVTDITKDDVGYVVGDGETLYGQFNKAVLAVGDVLSTRFEDAIVRYPDQVFKTPYHALPSVLEDNDENSTIVAFGTRSSFVDLVNGFISKGYKGKIIGISQSGQTSWQAREDRGLYPLEIMKPDVTFKNTSDILIGVRAELKLAKEKGVYVPDTLLAGINPTRADRLRWDFNMADEASNADQVTYHDVVQVINWEKLYQGLSSIEDKQRFNAVFTDFALYNRVNRIVPHDYKQFIENFESGRAEIIKTSFSQNDIAMGDNGKLAVKLANGQVLAVDYVVNCAIGPVSSQEQVQTHELLQNLTRKRWLSPRDGSSFDVAGNHAIDILGAQARPYPFTGIGLESYGRQIAVWVGQMTQEIASHVGPVARPTLKPWSHANG